MKKLLNLILTGMLIGCAASPQLTITEENVVSIGNPELRLKISDDMRYQIKGKDSDASMEGAGIKSERWVWASENDEKAFFIVIHLLTDAGWEWTGPPNSGWKKDIVLYESFPKRLKRGGKQWYVDIFRWGNYDYVLFGMEVNQKKLLFLTYLEKSTYETWEKLLKKADQAIEFLP